MRTMVERGEVGSEEEPRFSWLPFVPWAIVLALGIAALSVAPAHGFCDGPTRAAQEPGPGASGARAVES